MYFFSHLYKDYCDHIITKKQSEAYSLGTATQQFLPGLLRAILGKLGYSWHCLICDVLYTRQNPSRPHPLHQVRHMLGCALPYCSIQMAVETQPKSWYMSRSITKQQYVITILTKLWGLTGNKKNLIVWFKYSQPVFVSPGSSRGFKEFLELWLTDLTIKGVCIVPGPISLGKASSRTPMIFLAVCKIGILVTTIGAAFFQLTPNIRSIFLIKLQRIF